MPLVRGVYLVVVPSTDLSSCRHCVQHSKSSPSSQQADDQHSRFHPPELCCSVPFSSAAQGMAPNTSWEQHPTFSQPDSKVRARLWSVGGGWRQSGCGGVPPTRPPSRPPAPPTSLRSTPVRAPFSTRPPGWRPRPVAPPAERQRGALCCRHRQSTELY